MAERDVPVVYGGPESIFRVEDLRIEGYVARGSTPVGPWLTGTDGRIAHGAIGVFIDDVLGYATVAPKPNGIWSVSTDITMEIFPTLHRETVRFHAEAEALYVDDVGCFAAGTVVNDAGDLVATITQRGRYVQRTWTETDAVVTPSPPPEGVTSIDALIGAATETTEAGAIVELTATDRFLNPMGIMHGGISLCASDLAAALAVAGEPALDTASIRMVYLRPVPAGALVEYRTTTGHRGRSLGLVDVVGLVDGKVCTRAQITAQPR